MTTYAALLRGINVGGHHKVPMAELRALLAGLGHGDVRTYLQSGNAVFTAPERELRELAAELERAIADRFGFEIGCLVLTGEELRATAARCPFPADELDPAKLLVLFLGQPAATHPVATVDPATSPPDELRLGEREVFAYFPNGMGRSKLGDALTAAGRGTAATGRNWRTVGKLLDLTA